MVGRYPLRYTVGLEDVEELGDCLFSFFRIEARLGYFVAVVIGLDRDADVGVDFLPD